MSVVVTNTTFAWRSTYVFFAAKQDDQANSYLLVLAILERVSESQFMGRIVSLKNHFVWCESTAHDLTFSFSVTSHGPILLHRKSANLMYDNYTYRA